MGFIFSLLTICFHRHGCTIPDHENKSVIITGAGYKLGRWDRVLKYGLRGFIEELPSLINARRRHACAGYHKDGHFVSSKCLKYVLSRYLDLVYCSILKVSFIIVFHAIYVACIHFMLWIRFFLLLEGWVWKSRMGQRWPAQRSIKGDSG